MRSAVQESYGSVPLAEAIENGPADRIGLHDRRGISIPAECTGRSPGRFSGSRAEANRGSPDPSLARGSGRESDALRAQSASRVPRGFGSRWGDLPRADLKMVSPRAVAGALRERRWDLAIYSRLPARRDLAGPADRASPARRPRATGTARDGGRQDFVRRHRSTDSIPRVLRTTRLASARLCGHVHGRPSLDRWGRAGRGSRTPAGVYRGGFWRAKPGTLGHQTPRTRTHDS